jgi:hypothetical protein
VFDPSELAYGRVKMRTDDNFVNTNNDTCSHINAPGYSTDEPVFSSDLVSVVSSASLNPLGSLTSKSKKKNYDSPLILKESYLSPMVLTALFLIIEYTLSTVVLLLRRPIMSTINMISQVIRLVRRSFPKQRTILLLETSFLWAVVKSLCTAIDQRYLARLWMALPQ